MALTIDDPRQRELFEMNWLCHRPLAGKSKDGPKYRMSRERALLLPYIEANPLAMQSLIVTDHDGGRADEIASLIGLPGPSYIALNPHTRSGHIVYTLAAPVCLTDAAHRAPVNLLARIEQGLCAVLDGDIAYGGRITKNPTHHDHLPLWAEPETVYTLRELAGALDGLGALPKYNEKTVLINSAVGRNVALFELIRTWSYRRRGSYQDATDWEQVVNAYAQDRNQVIIGDQFTRGPMTETEVRHLARSISRWTWRKITRTFSEEQTRRGRNGGLKGGRTGGLATGPTKGQMTPAKREANRTRRTKLDITVAAGLAGLR